MLRNPVLSFLVLVSLTGPSIAISQQNEVSQAVQTTPITKVLAIGHLVSPPSGESFSSTMQSEVRDTVRLYLAGKIDQWYVRKDQNGVVLILNTPSVEDARVLLDSLPLGKAKMMQFDLIPLGPLSPLGLLLRDSPLSAVQR